ncbi:MAG: hypothetical protein WKF83_07775 [Nocardioidaceae bacterium]
MGVTALDRCCHRLSGRERPAHPGRRLRAGGESGAQRSARRPPALVSEAVLLATFAILMLVVGGVMAVRQVRVHRAAGDQVSDPDTRVRHARRHTLDDPIITFSPTFACQCPRALKVAHHRHRGRPAHRVPRESAAGSWSFLPCCSPSRCRWSTPQAPRLWSSRLTSCAALAVRTGVGSAPDWGVVLVLTAVSALGAFLGAQPG